MTHGAFPPIERLELPDGAWWELYSIVTRGMRKKFRDAGIRAFAGGLGNGTQPDLSDPAALQGAITAHPDKWDINAVDDAYLQHGTHATSYEGPFDSLPDAVTEQVLRRMRELYQEQPEAARKN